jgi:hypothetical protein
LLIYGFFHPPSRSMFQEALWISCISIEIAIRSRLGTNNNMRKNQGITTGINSQVVARVVIWRQSCFILIKYKTAWPI